MTDVPTPPAALQVSCAQLHWAKSLDRNLGRCVEYIGRAADAASRVVLFPEANLTSYHFPFVEQLDPGRVRDALDRTCAAAAERDIWVIAGTLRRTPDRFLNLAQRGGTRRS
jgi:predicted amidohydrolase